MAAATRPSPWQPLSITPGRAMDFDAIDRAWYAAGHTNEACGGYRFEPNSDPAKSLIRCACESVIPLPLEEVMGGEQSPPEMGNEDPAFIALIEQASRNAGTATGSEAAA